MLKEAKAKIAKLKIKKKQKNKSEYRKKKEYVQRDELVSYPVQ